MTKCSHENLTHTLEQGIIDCPKGCEGTTVDLVITCKDCEKVIYEVHEGHEGCKYGRRC